MADSPQAPAANELIELQHIGELERLTRENALLRLAVQEMPHGLSLFDGDDKLVFANRQVAKVWDVPETLFEPGTSFQRVLAGSNCIETEQSRLQPTPAKGSAGMRRREWIKDDGRSIEVSVTRLVDGYTIALHADITEQRRAQERIAFHARHDLLTGLPNRLAMRWETRS